MPRFFKGPNGRSLVSLSEEVLLACTEEVPVEFRIAPAGIYRSTKGNFLFDDDGAVAVMASWVDYSEDKVDGMVDYNHASLEARTSKDSKTSGEAAGWYSLELRPAKEPREVETPQGVVACNYDLWAVNVRWVGEAAQLMKDGKYRYFSPVFALDKKTRRICSVFNIALTNIPATKGQHPLISFGQEAEEQEKVLMDELMKLLGVTTEAAALDKISKMMEATVTVTALAGKMETLERAVCSATGAESIPAAMGTIAGWKTSKETAEALLSRVALLEKSTSTSKIVSLMSEFQDRVNPDVQAQVERTVALCAKANEDPTEEVRAYLNACPKMISRESFTAPEDKSAGTQLKVVLSKDEKARAIQLELTEEQYITDFYGVK